MFFPIAALSLNGCMGADFLARSASKSFIEEKSPAKRIAAAQEKAISAAHGGDSETPISWSEAKSEIEGAFLLEPNAEVPDGCHQYRQTIIIAGETLQGQITACCQEDASWKLAGEKPSSKKLELPDWMDEGQLTAPVTKRLFKEKSSGEKIAAAQEKAISAVRGGSLETPIPWSYAESGIEGAFLQEPNANTPEGCHQYRQTVSIAGETLQGPIVACLQNDGSWKLAGEKSTEQE